MADRPKLLFLCQTLPFPPDGGVHIRSYNILRLLARRYDVTALCFFRRATRPTQDQVARGLEGLGAHADVAAFPIPQEHSRLRLGWDHLRSFLLRRPYTYFAYDSAEYRARLKSLVAENDFAIVHMDSLDLSRHLDLVEGIPVVCTHHNVESALLERRAATESSWVMRWYVGHQAALMRSEERRLTPTMALNAAVSPDDARILTEIAPGVRVSVVPNGVDTGYFSPIAADADHSIVFVGGYSWYPNRDAMAYFAAEVLPRIRRRGEVACRWVGRASAQIAETYASRHGVHLTGYVDDVRPYIASAACYVVPLRVGGGTRLKVLDAWAMGKAIVSTSVGCEGLDARDGENILIRDDPEAFAEAVTEVLGDPELRQRLERNARQTAVETYEWERIGERMLEAYGAIADRREPDPELVGSAEAV